ncbi:hypothetical protein [Neorhizobium sp. S3-V5DH]|uniref:hypothetical protein n=1 Tax=Neorhizobium sp. S3-V5DH TaxID=2485166 RepID=UPI0010452CB3|nr:hypothetical protein [Neorhizobium sp. S3-V5DH]TCV66329.1 hypothetical protein EDE09_11680 [Neorhizobium sp. S3-V5DH]
MTRTTSVSSHTRRLPEKAPDPFAPVLEAKRAAYARKWGVELIGANDDRLAAPVADPVTGPGRVSLESLKQQLKDIAKMIGWQG